MPFVQWTEVMSVGDDVLDGHHQMIIDCLNRLQPLLQQEGGEDEIKAVLVKLEEFVLIHFSEEEQRLQAANYPDLRQHKDLHDAMYDAVCNLKADVDQGKRLEAGYLFDLLNRWLVEHILGEDKKYVTYLARGPAGEQHHWLQ